MFMIKTSFKLSFEDVTLFHGKLNFVTVPAIYGMLHWILLIVIMVM